MTKSEKGMMTRITHMLAQKGIDINNKEMLCEKIEEYTKGYGRPFTCRNLGVYAVLLIQSLYPDSIEVIGNGITTKNGKAFLDDLKAGQNEFIERNKRNENTFTVVLPKDIRKYIRYMRRELQEKYKMSIPLSNALQEFIRIWGEEYERKQSE